MSRKLDHRLARKSLMHKALAVPVAVLAAATLATGCSSSKSSGGTQTSSSGGGGGSSNTVEVKDFSFQPDSLTVKVGTKVTWKFDDSTAHTVKADDGSFKSDALSGGKTYDFTFNKAGTYSYICSIHPSMKAKVVVQ